MKVTIIHGKDRLSKDLPVVPEVGEQVRIKIPGLADRNLTIRNRRWIFAVMKEVEVELECS